MKEQLPAFVLSELFSNSLVYTGEKIIGKVLKEDIEDLLKLQKNLAENITSIKQDRGKGKYILI